MRWIDRRIPANGQHMLSHTNLFVFPTARGFIFLLTAAVLWMLGTNYQNNLILALAFFMFALLVVAILLTFNNLSGVELRFVEAKESFARESILCRFMLCTENARWADAIDLSWQGARSDGVHFNVLPEAETEVVLREQAKHRGEQSLPRLLVESVYPFGLVRCWTWLGLRQKVLIFPTPINERIESGAVDAEDGESLHSSKKGTEDFNGLRDYVPGDGLSRVAWKVMAKNQGVFVKDFSQSVSRDNWIDYDAVGSNSIERKLSIMCFWVLQFYQQDVSFGLRLPNLKIAPDSGFDHRTKCLHALARFGR